MCAWLCTALLVGSSLPSSLSVMPVAAAAAAAPSQLGLAIGHPGNYSFSCAAVICVWCHMMWASWRQPRLQHVAVVDRCQFWSEGRSRQFVAYLDVASVTHFIVYLTPLLLMHASVALSCHKIVLLVSPWVNIVASCATSWMWPAMFWGFNWWMS